MISVLFKVERAFKGVPMLALFESVAHKDLLVYSGNYYALGIARYGEGI